jgi:uncharacterized membrane protein YcaP (DUF421 family)
MWFESWDELGRVAVSALTLYVFLVASVRVAGKRATSQMNNFDWIVTVAIGAILGSGILLVDVAVFEAALACAVLLGAQYLVTKSSARWGPVSDAVRANPRLLVRDGECLDDALADSRVTSMEIEAAAREAGFRDLSEVAWVVLEADATLSVIGKGEGPAGLLERIDGKA